MQRILIATDGSDAAGRATAFATELARRFEAALYVAHVANGLPEDRVDEFIRAEHISLADFRASVSSQILESARDSAEAAGAPQTRIASLTGDPAEAILAFVAAERIDAIVIGKRGRGRLAGLLLGSVSQKLVTLAPCVVIVVP